MHYRLFCRCVGRRTLGNSGGHFSLAILTSFASLLVIPLLSRSDSESAMTLQPTVLNNSCALDINV
jgi:hypothetical protein